MNDKEAFEKWYAFQDTAGVFGNDDTCYVDLAWQAACEYARRENSNNNSEIINRLNQENKNLREALEEIKNSYAHPSRVLRISERALKEVGEE